MTVLRGPSPAGDTSLNGCIVTWGVFDGVHRGHHKVLESLVAWGQERRAPTVVVTFDRHPAEVLRGISVPLVVPVDIRVELISLHGVGAVIVLPFTVEFSKTTAESFVRDYIHGYLKASGVLLGHDSHFGKDRAGDFEVLKRVAGDLGIEVRMCEPQLWSGRPMSSTLIREYVAAGKLADAESILGRPYSIYGTIVKGEGRGASIGIPTANIAVASGLRPPNGVYAVEIPLDGKVYRGGANIGTRPTFHADVAPTIEVHILDYTGPSLLGRSMEIRFRELIRPERKFPGATELVAQIRKDLEWVKTRAWASSLSS